MKPVADQAAADAPPLALEEDAIDLQHLARMTLGERQLEAEVLALFDHQATILLARMRACAPAAAAAFAHTLKGSATGIGAWRVAAAAGAVQREAASCTPGGIEQAVTRLAAAIEEARAAIAQQLAAMELAQDS